MAATIKDIAKFTGLGYATISAYLNGVKVREYNRVKIENAIAELGYVRNEYARGLKTHRSMTIGILLPEIADTFFTAIVKQMEDIFRKNGYGIIVSDSKTNEEMEKESLRFLVSKMVDGMIIIPVSRDGEIFNSVIDRDIPVVLIDRLTANDRIPHIVINNREISKKAIESLIEKGHKNIALISGIPNIYTAEERKAGYVDALMSIDNYKEEYIFRGDFTMEGGYHAMKEIIVNQEEITAVFVTNYDMSLGAIIAINEQGKNIPNDYSFVAFDNMELSKIFNPQLVTINQPLKEIGQKAAELLIDQINKQEVEKLIVYDAEIIKGNSIKQLV